MRRGSLALVTLALALALAAATLLGACSKPALTTAPLYARVPVPAVPDRTAPPAGVPKDGQYWATKVTVTKNDGIVFSLSQAFFGATCTTELGADKCPNDVGVDESQKGEISIVPSALTVVTVVAANGQNYAIDGTELAHLVDGGAPSSGAPTDFRYSVGPYLVTVSAGVVTAANEVSVG